MPLPLTPTKTRPPAVVVAPPIIATGSLCCQRILPVSTSIAVKVPVPVTDARKLLRPRPADLERAAVIGTDLVLERLLRYLDQAGDVEACET